jgi:hypothetical protein
VAGKTIRPIHARFALYLNIYVRCQYEIVNMKDFAQGSGMPDLQLLSDDRRWGGKIEVSGFTAWQP